jgi:hypothetical protein
MSSPNSAADIRAMLLKHGAEEGTSAAGSAVSDGEDPSTTSVPVTLAVRPRANSQSVGTDPGPTSMASLNAVISQAFSEPKTDEEHAT